MKKMMSLTVLLIGIVTFSLLGQVETIFERNIPPGWKYRKVDISRSGVRALSLLPDLPEDQPPTKDISRRLQIFDNENILINDMIIPDRFYFSKITGNDNIILCDGDESGCGRIKVLDLLGNEKYTISAEDRWPVISPIGKDIALIPGPSVVGPVSIIDEDTGREKVRIGSPANNNKALRIACFFPLGEDGLYVQGVGATLFLKSYLHIGEVYWKIQDIGGNIEKGVFLNDRYLAIGYGTDDFRDHKFMAGVAIIESRTGDIVFNKKGFQINGVKDDWYSRLASLSLSVDDDSLLFYGDPDDVLSIPRCNDGRKGWEATRIKKLRLSPAQLREVRRGERTSKPEVVAGKYVIIDFGDMIRIEKCKYIMVQ